MAILRVLFVSRGRFVRVWGLLPQKEIKGNTCLLKEGMESGQALKEKIAATEEWLWIKRYKSHIREEVKKMPKYIDTHPMQPLPVQQLREAQNAPQDEFGVTHHDILFSEKDNKVWCILNAPNKDAVEKHHAKVGIKCELIYEVMSTKE